MPIFFIKIWSWLTGKAGVAIALLGGAFIALSRARRSGALSERRKHQDASDKTKQRVENNADKGLDALSEKQSDELQKVDAEIDAGRRDHFEDGKW